MTETAPEQAYGYPTGVLIDSNLLVLLVVGRVNRDRIEQFKRTNRYSKSDYDLLCKVLGEFRPLYTVAHVMAEVNDLTDLAGVERSRARLLLKDVLAVLEEPAVPSAHAANHGCYEWLGLVDAAIATAAREHKCAVLTDDLDLYCALTREGIDAINFTHLRAQAMGV